MTRALARATDRDEAELAHRLMGNWQPESITWHQLIEADDPQADAARPIRSIWRMGWTTRRKTWARQRIGRRNGSGTASAGR